MRRRRRDIELKSQIQRVWDENFQLWIADFTYVVFHGDQGSQYFLSSIGYVPRAEYEEPYDIVMLNVSC
ncbi:MAG: hypothetical protein HKM05_01030 [Spirochaetales bacterium]|nr:hypothetical protein [Spirochaetales bacterium]